MQQVAVLELTIVLEDIQATGGEHHRQRQQEGELRGRLAAETGQQAADDGGAGAAGTRDQGKHLRQADPHRLAVIQILDIGDMGRRLAINAFDDQEYDTADDEHDCHDLDREHGLDLLVKQESDDAYGDEGNYDFFPQFNMAKRELVTVLGDHREDGGELDDNLEGLVGRVLLHAQPLADDNHMTGRGYRQEFG